MRANPTAFWAAAAAFSPSPSTSPSAPLKCWPVSVRRSPSKHGEVRLQEVPCIRMAASVGAGSGARLTWKANCCARPPTSTDTPHTPPAPTGTDRAHSSRRGPTAVGRHKGVAEGDGPTAEKATATALRSSPKSRPCSVSACPPEHTMMTSDVLEGARAPAGQPRVSGSTVRPMQVRRSTTGGPCWITTARALLPAPFTSVVRLQFPEVPLGTRRRHTSSVHDPFST